MFIDASKLYNKSNNLLYLKRMLRQSKSLIHSKMLLRKHIVFRKFLLFIQSYISIKLLNTTKYLKYFAFTSKNSFPWWVASPKPNILAWINFCGALSLNICKGFVEAGTVTYIATQLAKGFGARRIYLYGMDLINSNQPRFYENQKNYQELCVWLN